jgi:hypothetical protein
VAVDAVLIASRLQLLKKEANEVILSSDAVSLSVCENFFKLRIVHGNNFFSFLKFCCFLVMAHSVVCSQQTPLETFYLSINDKISGQFERTLIIAEKSSVNYLEGYSPHC